MARNPVVKSFERDGGTVCVCVCLVEGGGLLRAHIRTLKVIQVLHHASCKVSSASVLLRYSKISFLATSS